MTRAPRPWEIPYNPLPTPSVNLTEALRLAALGKPVFPCAQTKRPLTAKGFKDATTDLDQIRAWWAQWPDALVGMPTGAVSGTVVLDLDRKGERFGGDSAPLPTASAPSTKTMGGGEHRYFAHPGAPVKNGVGVLGKDSLVDIRGDGGYVIVYAPIDFDAMPPWPADFPPSKEEPAPAAPHARPEASGKRLDAYAQAALDAEIEGVRTAPKGGRNHALNQAAFAIGTMVGGGWLAEREAAALLEDACVGSGLWKDDGPAPCRKTINSGLRAGMARPREAPEDRPLAVEASPHWDGVARAMVASAERKAMAAEEPLPTKAPYVEPSWCRPGGLLGAIADWVESTAIMPNRPLAMAAAISTMGTLMSRHLQGPTELQANLYVAMLGQTAIGKDRPLRAPGKLLRAAGLGSVVTSGNFKSSAVVEDILLQTPCTLAVVDEIGAQLFKRMTAKNSSSHETAISGLLRELWAVSFDIYKTSNSRACRSQDIDSPALSIFGASTFNEFYASLGGDSLENGTLNRFLLIEAAPRGEPRMDFSSPPPSQDIIDAMLAILPPGGNLTGGSMALTTQDPAPPYKARWEMDAQEAYLRFRKELAVRLDAGDYGDENCFGRTPETALKLAHIHAVSRFGRMALVTLEDWEWGKTVAIASAEFMLKEVYRRISDNAQHEAYNMVLRLIPDVGEIKMRDLGQKIKGRIKKKDIDDIIAQMAEYDTISRRSVVPKNGGPPSVFIKKN